VISKVLGRGKRTAIRALRGGNSLSGYNYKGEKERKKGGL